MGIGILLVNGDPDLVGPDITGLMPGYPPVTSLGVSVNCVYPLHEPLLRFSPDSVLPH